MKTTLSESIGALPAPVDGVYRIRLIESDVHGSSGYYSRELLERDGSIAFPKGTRIFMNHATEEEVASRPERRVEDIGGYTITDPTLEADGLYADAKFAGKGLEIVENFSEVIGMSIRAQGDVEESDRDGVVVREVLAIHPSVFNSCDLVVLPGAGGKVISALEESMKVSGTNSADLRKVSPMEIEELANKVDALTEAINGFVATASPILESLKPAEETEVDVVEAVIAANKAAADLPEALRDEVIEAVKADPKVDYAALIEKKAALVESIRGEVEAPLQESAGRILTGATYKNAAELGKVL